MNSELLHGFYLGELLIEPLKGQVTGRAGSKHLPPKAVEVLLCLAREPGELVTREHLLEEVWGAGHGSQEALGHAVSEIRHAFDDHHDDPHYIQTLPKRGYRLVVEPVPADEHSASVVIGANHGATAADIGFFENLKQRGVLETAIAYLIVGWLLIQIADIVFGQLLLPQWAGTFVTVLVIAGFPIALVLSWYLEFRDGKAVVDTMSPLDARRRRFSRTYMSVIGALAVAGVLVFIYDYYLGLPEQETQARATEEVDLPVAANSIAVLPFVNNDGSEETQIFANGLVDDVITRLSRVPGLLVSSRGDSTTLEPNSPSELVRRRLRVAMYIEGSVEISGDTIRVIVQLIDSSTGFNILSRTFDHPKQDYFAIRDEVTQTTVASLRVTLPDDVQEIAFTPTAPPDLDAYVLYRRGIDELSQPDTIDVLASALGWFDAALEVDPDFAAAHAANCRAYINVYDETDDPASIVDAETSCARALELNPNLDVVHTALGDLHAKRGNNDDAEAAFLEAIRINPKNVEAMIGISNVYRLQKRADDAESILLQANGLQPGNWLTYSALGVFYYRQGRFAEAAEQFRKITLIDERNIRGHSNMAASLMLAGKFEEALPAYQKSIDIDPQPITYSNLGLMNYYLGNYDDAAAAVEAGIELAPSDYLLWMNLGDILDAAGKTEESRSAFTTAEELTASNLEVNANEPELLLDLAWIKAMLDNESDAYDYISRASDALPDDPYADYVRGLIHNRFGNQDAAIDAFELAVDNGYSRVMLSAEPHLQQLKEHARFRALLEGPQK